MDVGAEEYRVQLYDYISSVFRDCQKTHFLDEFASSQDSRICTLNSRSISKHNARVERGYEQHQMLF